MKQRVAGRTKEFKEQYYANYGWDKWMVEDSLRLVVDLNSVTVMILSTEHRGLALRA